MADASGQELLCRLQLFVSVLLVGNRTHSKVLILTSFEATIICPDDLIATVAALTLAIRVIGGSIGYCV